MCADDSGRNGVEVRILSISSAVIRVSRLSIVKQPQARKLRQLWRGLWALSHRRRLAVLGY